MPAELKLLLLEDNPHDAIFIQRLLQRSGMVFSSSVASDEKEFLAAIADNRYDVVLADNALPQYSSLEALKIIQDNNPDIAFILVTGTVSEEFAVKIMQQGADDYILKTNLTRLPAAISKAIEKKRMRKENEMEKQLSGSIINSLPGVFYFYNGRGNILRWNKNFETVSGYTPDEIKKMKVKDFFEKNKQAYKNRWIKKVFAEGYAEAEVEVLTKNGKKIPYYFTGSTIYFNEETCLIGIGMDISAGKKSEEALIQLNKELRSISAHLEEIREEEQARIAREIHDQLGQQLTGFKMDIAWIKKRMRDHAEPGVITEKLDEMSRSVDEAVKTVRKVAADLRPGILDDFGLVEALDWQGEEFTKRSGVVVHFDHPEEECKFDNSVAIGLFRIYQEILTNVARHANAKTVTSALTVTPKQILLIVKDDGNGFKNKQKKKTMGLLGMKERAHAIGGTVSIHSKPGKGTEVTIAISRQDPAEKK